MFLFQATSPVSIITLLDLTGVARIIVARSFAVYEVCIAAGILYPIVTYGILFRLPQNRARAVGPPARTGLDRGIGRAPSSASGYSPRHVSR